MHVVMLGDQPIGSLGGAQVSMRLQRRHLERAGHTVTVVAPRAPRAPARAQDDVGLFSLPMTMDREYAWSWPGAAGDRAIDAALAQRPPVDVVHVQGDFWGAYLGYRLGRRHELPVVHTMHNRVDVGIAALTPFPRPVLAVLHLWQTRQLGRERAVGPAARDGWSYLGRFGREAAAVTAPSTHFADRLRAHGVAESIDVVPNGIDDDALDRVLSEPPGPTGEGGRPRLLWLGRMSPEKRVLPFLRAVAESGVEADVEVIGGGNELAAAKRLVTRLRPQARVRFPGRLPYVQALRRIRSADAVVQSSLGFETQGMTVFEAASLGTAAVVCDPDIAHELGRGYWLARGQADDPRDSDRALAQTLRDAVADIRAGHPPRPDEHAGERMRQSTRTAQMLRVYERVTA
ncbi:glycosyltransferase [Microbacterium sp. LRZ72]|uniref:glycosyltransferase n=1 Tax=Microbacterium sp. LRZ72 TaxID=2942481 RepID=UPI0029B8A6FE|nr:glycosyltransferase [Microbacterium sp. LRZ72]MDX2377961.1 glycosyltransferase [Microbacterium sp. LRZ72]